MLLLTPGMSSCAFFYDNHHVRPGFAVHSDRDSEFVADVGEKVERIIDAYTIEFGLPREQLGYLTIVLQGTDTNVIDYTHTPEVLGYYVPIFNFISVDTTDGWPHSDELLDQILMHEIAHHFIVTQYSAASRECWLNEGVAGVMEMTLENGSHFEFPLFNPTLYQLARHVAYTDPEVLDVQALLQKTWTEFHTVGSKEAHYALSWSLVYFILVHYLPADQPFAERVKQLYSMDRAEIVAQESEWIDFLRQYEVESFLLKLATSTAPDSTLTAYWAIRQLGRIRTPNDLRALRGLRDFFDDDDPFKRYVAYEAFLQRLERSRFSFVRRTAWIHETLQEIGEMILSTGEPVPARRQLLRSLGDCVVLQMDWIPVLIQALDSTDGSLRETAAQSLVRLSNKPTVTNPRFWREASSAKRAVEVDEWKLWWQRLAGD